MAKAKKKKPAKTKETTKTKFSFRLKEEKEAEVPKKVIKSKPKAKKGENIPSGLKNLTEKIDRLEQALKDKENVIQSLQDEAKEQLNLIREIQKRARRAPKADQKAKVFEKISRLGKIKGDKVREGQRTIAGILMGLSFHLYFTLHGIDKFTISALLLFSGLCFFMSVIFTFVLGEKWENFPTYMLILGASGLVVNSNFVMIYRMAVPGLVTNISDPIIIFLMFPIVFGIVGIIYLIQEVLKKRN